MAEKYSIFCIYHILFICSSVDGTVGCLHLLFVVNNAVMLYKSLNEYLFSVLWGIYLGVELLACMVILSLTFRQPISHSSYHSILSFHFFDTVL